jgi:hypothetical protein
MNDQGQGGWGPRPPPTTQPGQPSWQVSPYDAHAPSSPQHTTPAPFGQPPGQAVNPYAIVPHQQAYPQQAYPQQAYLPPGAYVPGFGAPTSYKNIGVLMLISGVKGAIISFAWFISLIWVCVGAFWLITLAGAMVEIVVGAMMMSGKVVTNPRIIAIIGIVNSVLCFNIIGVVLEAIALSQMNKPEVEHYISHGPR